MVVDRAHERSRATLTKGIARSRLIVEPERRGTAAAVMHGLLHIASEAWMAVVTVVPFGLGVIDDALVATHVARAAAVVRERPDLIVLLGVKPHRARRVSRWIERGDAIGASALHRVQRLWDRPAPAIAASLFEHGALANTSILVAHVATLLSAIRSALPDLSDAFAAVEPVLGSAAETRAIERAYTSIAPASFSEHVLGARPANLATLAVADGEAPSAHAGGAARPDAAMSCAPVSIALR